MNVLYFDFLMPPAKPLKLSWKKACGRLENKYMKNNMNSKENNFAYIDGANLHKGVESSAWKLDYRRFRSWIRQKFDITNAFLFIGLMSKHADLYTSLQSMSL